MLSMCGLLCRMLRGWRHSEAVMLMAKALSQPHSSLLVQDILASDSGIVKVNEPSCTSLFCQNSNEGSVGQLLWRDNNKQAVVIAPKQRVDLKRWTLFMMAADQLSNSHGRESAQQASENGFPSAKPEVTTTITVLLEASYREQEDNQLLDCYVMVEQLSQPYAWKARDVFGIIVTTTPPQLLAMIQAFFNNALIVDDDFLITKIITVDLVGQPSTFDDPLSIPESVTPGPWTTERASCTQMELARSVSPTNYTVGQLSVREGDLMGACGISLHPPTLSAVLRQQSSAESATDTSTTLHPQSSSDSDKRASSLDPQSSYDSVSDYPTSDTDDLSCNVYNFYPRGWAVSGQQVVSGQPLSVRGVLNQLEGKQYRKPCSIVSNPMEDLWQESDDKTKVVDAGNVYQHGSLRCMNGPSGFSRRSEALLKVQSGSSECSYPYQCIPGKVICQNIQYSAPGKAEQEIVKEAAEYYQRAVSSAQERREWAKKSLSSTSEDDGPPCKFSFSDTKEKAVVTQEPKRQPVRINSEADLSRATNIIKENLANIVENYLVKHGSSEYQHLVSRAKTNDDRNLETDTHSGSQGVNVNVRDKVIHTTTSRVLNDQYEVTKTQDVQQISISISFEDDEKLVTEIIGGRDEGLVSVVDTKKAPVEGFSAEEISGYLTKREEYPHKPVEEDQSPVLSPVEGSGVCKSTGRSEKKLVKSEELLPPTMKRESCIDIPNNDDEFRSVTRFEDQSIQERAWLEKEELPGSLIVKSEAVINISETFIGNGNFDEPSRNNEKMLEMLQLHKNDLIEAPDTKKEDTSEELIDLEIESKLKEKELAEVSKSPTLKECFQIIESHKKEEKVSNIEEVVHTDNVDTTSTENVDSSRIKDIDQSLAGNDNKYTDIPIILDSVQENIAVNEKRNQKLSLISEIEENGDGTHLEIQEKGQVDEVSDDDSSQKPRCLKEIHKLNTKSSTTSESSFESLPYRMLSSQPDSLNDDLGLVIELTSAPIDSEKALAAKRELIRQERMAAMSLMSGTLLESRDEIRSEAIFEKGSEFETVDAEKCSDVDAVHEEENLEMNAMAAAASTQEEDRESYPSSLFDSGVDIVMHEHVSSINSSLSKSLVSPVESAAESGFSSLKEPLVPEGAMVEDSGPGEHRGVCLSKSKDSLDLTDTDKFPGTDTLSDDMETLSSNAGDITLVESGPVSKEGSARGSVSDGIYQDNGYLRYGSESSHLDLDSVGIPNTYLKGSHYEATAAIEDMSGRDELPPNAGGDQLTQQNLMRHAEKTSISTDIVDYCNRLQKLSLDYVKASSSEKFDQKSAKYLPDDSETSKRKTSESISSEDTVISKVSAEEQNNKIQSQGSQEDQMELPESLQECSEYEDLNKTGDYDVGMENGEPCKSPVSHIAINGKISISSGEGIELKERYSAVTPTVPLGADQECDIAVEGKSEENERLLDMKNRSEITEQKADESVHKEGSINGSSLAGSVERKHSSVGHKSRGSTLTSSTSQSEEIPRDATVADKALGQENYSPKDSTRHVFPDAAKQSSQSEKTSMSSAEKESNIQPVHATETEKSRKSNKSKSEVSDKSSPNARETCSNSDRPSRHSSRSGVSDLEDEVFLPPSENYIFDGRPVIYCPKIDMADQIGIEHPQVAMSVFAVIPSKEIKSGKDGRWEEHMGKGSAFKMADYYAAQDSKIQKEEKDKPLVVSEFRKISEGFTVVEDNILIEEGQSKAQIESDTSEESVEWKNKTAEIKAPLRCIGGAPLTDDYTHIEGTEIEPVANVQEELKTTKTDSEGWTPSKDSANANKMDNEALGEGKMEEGSDTKGTCKAAREIHPAVRSKRADGGGQSNLKNGEEVHSSQTILKSGVSDIESKSHRESAIYDDRVRSYESEWVIAADGHTIINPVFQESPISPFTTQTNNLIEESPKPSDYRVFDLSKPAIDEASDHSKPKLARMANLERSDTSMAIQRVSDMEVLPVNKVAIKILDNDESVPQSPILSPLSPKFSCKTNSTSFSGVKEAVAVAEETITRRRTGSDANDHTISDKANEKRLNTSKREGKVFDFDKVPDLEECKSQGTGSLKSKESEESEISNVTSNEDYSAKSEPEMKTEGDERLSTQTLDEQRSVSKGDIRSGWAVGGSLERLERTSSSKEGKGHHQGSISSAKSEDLGMKCEKVSLKSQGSLDKFPHFDQISAQQKARGARKKVLSVDTEGKDKLGKEKSKEMHRSATLPVGSLSVKKEDKKKEKDEKVKKKKKEKEVGVVEKKSAMSSLKGLLKRSKPKEKEKEKDKEKDKDSSSQEKLSSPSLFRKFERKSRSNTHSPLLDDKKNSSQGKVTSSTQQRDVDKLKHSPVAANGKTRPVISSPVDVRPLSSPAEIGSSHRSSSVVGASGSESESPASSHQSSPKRIVNHTRKTSMGNQPSPRLYRHVLTRNLSSSQESVDNPMLSSSHSTPQTSPHTSPKRRLVPASASSYSLPASRDMSPPAPVMGTRALRGSNNSFSVTIGFKPTVEKHSRTMSEGADLNKVAVSPVCKRKEGSGILTQLNKRSSSMEILVFGKIREHCSEGGKSPGGSPFSREGSFRLHREISVETLFELPETSPRSSKTQEEYQEYLNEVQARNDSQHGSSWSLFEESEMEAQHRGTPKRRSSHHTTTGKKLSLPHNMHLSGLRETASSNPNLQRCGSPFIRGVSHSSSFTSSPFRRPHSSTAVFSPAKRVMSSVSGLSPPGESSPGMPLMRVEEEGPCRKNLDVDTGKPPNVLVYAANKADYFEAVRDTLVNCLNQDRYTVYQLTDEMAFKSPWAGSTTLLVVCGDVPAHVSTVFIRYLLQGGRVLSICSDFLNVAVPLFAFELPWTSSLVASGTVEVQEQAVVSISYRRWSSVQLLHHQHCFHSSPKNKRFSQDLEKTSKKVSRSAVSVEPTHVEITDECGGQHRLNLSILATDDTWGAPSLLSARLHGGNGKAVFSQVHLERDPQECFGALNVPSKLSVSNEARLEILRDLLNSELSMDTTGSSSSCVYTAAYFLGRHELKQDLLNKLQPHLENQELKRPQLILQFVNAREIAKQADEDLLPLLMNACPMTFSTVRYFETLKTTAIGRLVIYCDVMTSSMKVIAGHPPLIHGITVVPTQQTQGKGRSGNTWLSPLGCAMFSTQLHIPLSSNLGQHLPFLQHLVAIAIVQAVREYPGYGDIPLNLKWPNDIYIAGDTKVGGVIVEATTIGKEVIANVGCGINLSNSNPTYCINDAVRQHNKEHKTSLPEIDRETFLARVFNHFEGLIDTFQTDGPEAVCPIYYKYWLHSNAVVTVQNENRCIENAVITGVDNYGFLEAHLVDGTMITLQPDGNSFDMMEGLIYSKIH
ncbi:uncharacterized protein LOC122255619 isoform X2 [Penaeus japonicus]|uniref:uncharacterized protein LOC122255619 isoform X2 n=1 Tax=Penaeus japonicus TaxID=27405 RepID=UPI001C70FE2A|nr:uncharacterized protein LOC122255619 isoform X2 [Penaeus japonicus]